MYRRPIKIRYEAIFQLQLRFICKKFNLPRFITNTELLNKQPKVDIEYQSLSQHEKNLLPWD